MRKITSIFFFFTVVLISHTMNAQVSSNKDSLPKAEDFSNRQYNADAFQRLLHNEEKQKKTPY